MIELCKSGVYLLNGSELIRDDGNAQAALKARGLSLSAEEGRKGTIAYGILKAHDRAGDGKNLSLMFDSLTSHDITYVGIIQTARASGMEKFPVPYVLTNCHNSLSAVGGTINSDDHVFALSAAKKYGGIYVPPHLAVIHSYNREMAAGCGKMILGSDSHTRYGALGTIAVGEGGGELAKQLVGRTYDMAYPEVVAVYLSGRPAPGVGPMDVALSIVGAVFKNGYVKNKVMEFVGDGIANLSVDYRNGIDVMTTETACWSSIWKTDDKVKEYLEIHGRKNDYRELSPAAAAYYDGLIHVDLSKVEPSIALPFHPSNVYTIRELNENAEDILAKVEEEGSRALGESGVRLALRNKIRDNGIWADQAIIAGCSGGTFGNIMAAADILKGKSIGSDYFSMSVYPDSQPNFLELTRQKAVEELMACGVVLRSAFCGPCFGAGDTPANGEFSIRHTTRNFPNREGSKPNEGQIASVALMDARSVAASAIQGGRLCPATELDIQYTNPDYFFDRSVYDKRVYNGWGRPLPGEKLIFGPNIKDWPAMPSLPEHLLIKIVSVIQDTVTTTDELIPSGETSSYRSNPVRLAEFTLSRKDPAYVGRAKEVQALETERKAGGAKKEIESILANIKVPSGIELSAIGIGSAIYARKPGDGSAREQAASCQRVLGAQANFAVEYATKRYRSNLINWGILPFVAGAETLFHTGDYVLIPDIKKAVREGDAPISAYVTGGAKIELSLGELTAAERQILIDGCLINYYAAGGRS
ncbi:MAG: hydratase [Spirochaetaceae bacterium]|jgi:aconitate hydratase|nr:hydratase [Spirochaetaceae bacterium]